DNLTNVRGLSFRVTDSPNMLTAMNVTPVNRALSFSVTKVDNGTHVTIYMVSMSAGVITIGSGPIATISYDVSASAPVGDYAELSLSEVTVADANSQPIVPDLIDGKFFFVMKGDILADGIVDSLDLERAIQLLLKTGPPMTPTELLCGDLDADGDFDLIDFMNIWEMIY
ncbi:MAG TPA: dockerin type I domain-containing protein, partial [bacterium]|nr:dockerin type I domain-containing protein [bacterium]